MSLDTYLKAVRERAENACGTRTMLDSQSDIERLLAIIDVLRSGLEYINSIGDNQSSSWYADVAQDTLDKADEIAL